MMAQSDSTNLLSDEEGLLHRGANYFNYLKTLGGYIFSVKGILAPYEDGTDFFLTLLSPIRAPLFSAAVIVATVVIVSVALLVSVGCLVAALCALPFDSKLANFVLDKALTAAVLALGGTVGLFFEVLAAAVSMPSAIITFFTRSGATVAKALGFFANSNDDGQMENSLVQKSQTHRKEDEKAEPIVTSNTNGFFSNLNNPIKSGRAQDSEIDALKVDGEERVCNIPKL